MMEIETCKCCPYKDGCYKEGAKSKTYSVTMKSDIHKKQMQFQESEYFKNKAKERYKMEAKIAKAFSKHDFLRCFSLRIICLDLYRHFFSALIKTRRTSESYAFSYINRMDFLLDILHLLADCNQFHPLVHQDI